MEQFYSQVPLAPYTTFGVGGPARLFSELTTSQELADALAAAGKAGEPVTVLGGGSNVVIDDDGIAGVVIRLALSGVSSQRMQDGSVLVEVAAGETWDRFVADAVERGWWGVENLSGIPGSVGAAPVQNIGAYGSELADVLVAVDAVDSESGVVQRFTSDECAFGYRRSFFKTPAGRRWIITNVVLRLSSVPAPNIIYRDLAEYFAGRSDRPSLAEIREAVRAIRSEKFPDWHVEGTAGSFFTNPIVDAATRERLREHFPALPIYELGDGRAKVSAAWLLDHVCGLKGYRRGPVRLFEQQPLVLVADPGASAADIYALAGEVQETFCRCTGLELHREVRYLPHDLH